MMRRRELVAGLLGAGVVGAGGVLASPYGPNLSTGEDDQETWDHDPITIETVDAPGSEAGTVTIPDGERPYVIEFFATTCSTCTAMKPEVVEAESRSEGVMFLSVTNEPVPDYLSEEELVSYWEDVDGNWSLGLDPESALGVRYDGLTVPTMVALDTDGAVQWRHRGSVTTEEVLEGVEAATEA